MIHLAPAAYTAVAIGIFIVVSFTFFFPCNFIIPLDRRSCAVVGAVACYISRVVLFPSNSMNVVEAVDFDVLVLLVGIMTVNFIVVNQSETKTVICRIQKIIQSNPKRGFWVTSVAVFVLSPFLTNDGVCLLFVEPMLLAFQSDNASLLRSEDSFFFLISLACSSNIGSALTYTGNPQNMMVSEDSIGGNTILRQ